VSGKPMPLEPRFEKFVNRTETCWLWTGYLLRGYGRFWFRGKIYLAHRWSYERFVEPIPNGLSLDHLCRVTNCVNPAHLEPVTHRENCLRGVSPVAAHAKKTHCPRGHEYDGVRTYRGSGEHRFCYTCKRAQQRANDRRIKGAASKEMETRP
jgi:hypothetical protein